MQISEEEISFLTGGDDPYDDDVVLNKLYHRDLKLLLVTEGPAGCRYYTKVNIHFDAYSRWPVDPWSIGFLSFLLFSVFSKFDDDSFFTVHEQEFKGKVAGIKANCVDTTGAGDSFVASVLNSLALDPELYKVYTSFFFQGILG